MLGQMGCQAKAISGHSDHILRLHRDSVIWWILSSTLVPFKIFGVCTFSLSQLSQHVTRECVQPVAGMPQWVSWPGTSDWDRPQSELSCLRAINHLSKPPGFYPFLLARINPAWWELGLTAWIWEVPEEQWQISGGESALSGPDPRRREEEFFLFQREDPHFYKWYPEYLTKRLKWMLCRT